MQTRLQVNIVDNRCTHSLCRRITKNILSLRFAKGAAVGELHGNLCGNWPVFVKYFTCICPVFHLFSLKTSLLEIKLNKKDIQIDEAINEYGMILKTINLKAKTT